MSAEFDRPITLQIAERAVETASRLVPDADRRDWTVRRLAEIQYRYRFVRQVQGWSLRSRAAVAALGIRYTAEACWLGVMRDEIREPATRMLRSPWTCLGALAFGWIVLALLTGWFPATRQLVRSYLPLRDGERVLFLWMHPFTGSEDRGIPQEVVTGWNNHGKTLRGAAGFQTYRAPVRAPGVSPREMLVVQTEQAFFTVLGVQPEVGYVPADAHSGILLTRRAWAKAFRGDPRVLGTSMTVGEAMYQIIGILPDSPQLPARTAEIYVIDPPLWHVPVMAMVRVKNGVDWLAVNRDLRKTAEEDCYFFFGSQLRHVWRDAEVQTPARFFAVIVAVIAALLWRFWPFRARELRAAFRPETRNISVRRYGFFFAKTALALLFVFTGCLEWRRSGDAVIFASQDPANGPLIVWFFVVGILAALVWSAVDQHARCRECLELLGFPVRIGSPGSLLLDWSGTELLCPKGHGMLHIPHMPTSWDQETEHWVALDDSWRGLFNR